MVHIAADVAVVVAVVAVAVVEETALGIGFCDGGLVLSNKYNLFAPDNPWPCGPSAGTLNTAQSTFFFCS